MWGLLSQVASPPASRVFFQALICSTVAHRCFCSGFPEIRSGWAHRHYGALALHDDQQQRPRLKKKKTCHVGWELCLARPRTLGDHDVHRVRSFKEFMAQFLFFSDVEGFWRRGTFVNVLVGSLFRPPEKPRPSRLDAWQSKLADRMGTK